MAAYYSSNLAKYMVGFILKFNINIFFSPFNYFPSLSGSDFVSPVPIPLEIA